MTKTEMTETKKTIGSYRAVFILNFEHLNFEFVSNFGFRASDFLFFTNNSKFKK